MGRQGGWGEALWDVLVPLSIRSHAGTSRYEAAGAWSIHTGVGLAPSAPHSRDHGGIQCLDLGSPQYKMWANCVSSSRAPSQMVLAQPGAQMAPEALAAARNQTIGNGDKKIPLKSLSMKHMQGNIQRALSGAQGSLSVCSTFAGQSCSCISSHVDLGCAIAI